MEKETKEKAPIVQDGVHNYTGAESYVPPNDPEVEEGIRRFMGRKLGLMMHWAPGCQLSTYESWALSDEDAAWSQDDINWTDIETFKKQYWNANKTFYPYRFRPDKMAAFAKDCGFRYLLFTTKHHDGFCMFDTKTTDYKVTDPSCPYHDGPYANIVKEMFDAFRNEGLAIHCYFSKPDWHSKYYWSPKFAPAVSRHPNYDTTKYPEIWDQYVEEIHTQLRELMNDYGHIDCLWLDGGWVRPSLNQDLRLLPLIEEFRKGPQPGLVVCDRTCGGILENVVTPEKQVPEEYLPIPWETCTTLGKKFSFHYKDEFKSPAETIELFLDIVAKGGCLALNVAPQPDGELPENARITLMEVGRFMRTFGDAIYETEPAAPYTLRRCRYLKKDSSYYIFFIFKGLPNLPNDLILALPKELDISKLKAVRSVRTGEDMPYRYDPQFGIIIDTRNFSLRDALYAEAFELVTEA